MSRTDSAARDYGNLAFSLRERFDAMDSLQGLEIPSSLKVEILATQGRKSIETIAFMLLVGVEGFLGNGTLSNKILTGWSAEKIFRLLARKGIEIWPSPSRWLAARTSEYSAIFEGVPERRVSRAEMIDLYNRFHSVLHQPNPFKNRDWEAQLSQKETEVAQDYLRIKELI